jgi:hypothetical protein
MLVLLGKGGYSLYVSRIHSNQDFRDGHERCWA